jgi:RNA polymerase sigma factor (sigma-70 family)
MIPLPDLTKLSFPNSTPPTISRVSSAEIPTRPRTSYRRHFFELIEALMDIVAEMRAWIFAIVRNCYHSWLMDRRRNSRLEVNPKGNGGSEEVIHNISPDEDTPEALLLRKAESQAVRFILSTMPRAFREILVLRELEELSYRQISDITALPIGTVMSRLARARKAFGDALGPRDKNAG